MHSRSELLALAVNLSRHCPRAGDNSPETLAALALDWVEDFEAFPIEAVRQGFKYARREARFFPSTAELIEFICRAKGELERFQERMALPAPEQSTEAICERGAAGCKAILARLDAAQDVQ